MKLFRELIFEVVAGGQPMTVRHCFYELVVANVIEKLESQYDAVGRQLVRMRAEGIIPYNWITDNTRLIRKPDTWSDVPSFIEATFAAYRRSLWEN